MRTQSIGTGDVGRWVDVIKGVYASSLLIASIFFSEAKSSAEDKIGDKILLVGLMTENMK